MSETTQTCFPLATEVTDLVVDHLYDDKSTLQSLALVSHQWRWCSQYHLFYNFRLQAWKSNYTEKLDRFMEFVKRSPSIAVLIRKITLGKGPFYYASTTLELSWILNVLQLLPSLHTLVLHSCTLQATDMTDIFPLSPVRKLVLSSVRADVDSLHRYFFHIPTHTSLHLLGLTVSTTSLPSTVFAPESVPSCFSTVKDLTLELGEYVNRSTLSYYDVILDSMNDLDRVDVSPFFQRTHQFDQLSKYLQEKGTNLKHLRLELSCSSIIPQEGGFKWSKIDLALHSPNLQSLHFTLFVRGLPMCNSSDAAQWDYALFLLSMTPRTIRHLTFGLFCNGGLLGLSVAPKWKELDEKLSTFGALSSVKFQQEKREGDGLPMAYHTSSLPQRWEEFVREQLPQAEAAGLLRFR